MRGKASVLNGVGRFHVHVTPTMSQPWGFFYSHFLVLSVETSLFATSAVPESDIFLYCDQHAASCTVFEGRCLRDLPSSSPESYECRLNCSCWGSASPKPIPQIQRNYHFCNNCFSGVMVNLSMFLAGVDKCTQQRRNPPCLHSVRPTNLSECKLPPLFRVN